MHALKIPVENGRVTVDQPTDLRKGADVEVVVIDDEPPTTRVRASLDRPLDDSEAGTRNGGLRLSQAKSSPP